MRILKGALALRLQSCSDCSTRTVSSTLRNVFFWTHVDWRVRPFGSSITCELPTPSKVRRRLWKAERRAMVQSFVSRYRATHGGKFPGTKVTQKEVGGSFYIVREILQELKFESKTYLLGVASAENDASSAAINEVVTDRDTRYKNAGGDSQSQISASCARRYSAVVVEPVFPASNREADKTETNERDPVAISDTISNGIKDASEHLSGASVIIAMDDQLPARETGTIPWNYVQSKQDSASHRPGNQTNVVSDACFKKWDPHEEPNSLSENCKTYSNQEVKEETGPMTPLLSQNPREENEKVMFENSMRIDGRESKADHHQGSPDLGNVASLEEEESARKVSDRGASDVQSAKRTGFWSNIKSLADEIVKFWRKG